MERSRFATRKSAAGLTTIAAVVASCGVGGLFLVAAALKINAPTSFLAVVAYLLPDAVARELARPVSAGVVGWEALLGAGLVLAGRDRRVLGAAAGTILLFSGVLVALAATPGAPSCSCFGPLDAAERAGVGLWNGLARNAGLLIAVGWLWSRGGRDDRAGALTPPAAARGAGSVAPARPAESREIGSRGFTLVELLVSLAIVALLASLVVPSLRHARHEALYTVSAATQRQLLAGLEAYAKEHEGLLPFLATPGRPFDPISVLGKSVSNQGYFPDQSAYWSLVVNAEHVGLPDVALACPAALLPMDGPLHDSLGLVRVPRFRLSHTALARPGFWRDAGTIESIPSLSLLAPQRLDSVAFPSAKGLTIDVALGFHNPEGDFAYRPIVVTGWGDGSVATFAMQEAATGVSDLFIRQPFHGANPMPVWATRNGLLGRDR